MSSYNVQTFVRMKLQKSCLGCSDPHFLPVAFDFSYVGHAAHAEAEVLSVKGSSDGTGNAGLSHTGGSVETQDLPLCAASQLANCDKLLIDIEEPWISTHSAWNYLLYYDSELRVCLREFASSHPPCRNDLPPAPHALVTAPGSPHCWCPMALKSTSPSNFL